MMFVWIVLRGIDRYMNTMHLYDLDYERGLDGVWYTFSYVENQKSWRKWRKRRIQMRNDFFIRNKKNGAKMFSNTTIVFFIFIFVAFLETILSLGCEEDRSCFATGSWTYPLTFAFSPIMEPHVYEIRTSDFGNGATIYGYHI